MSHIEMDFYNFIRQIDHFFKGKIMIESVEKSNARIIAEKVVEVMEALDKLKQIMDYNQPKVLHGDVSDEQVRIEALLNPFNFMKVKVATHILGSTEIHAEKMNFDEARKRLKI